jgi:CRISPR/Cas system-associated exonuclease Cas4 (RecB family)
MIRISQAGACPRRVELEAWGVEGEPFSEMTLRAFEEGNLHESSILKWASEQYDLEITDQQREVKINDWLIGHIDAIGRKEGEKPILLEAKTLRRRAVQEMREKGLLASHYQYYVQVQLYLHVLSKEEGITHAMLIARDKETPPIRLWEHHVEHINYDKEFAEQKIKELAEIQKAIEEGIEIDMPYHPDMDWQCRWCPYLKRCYPDWRKKQEKAELRSDLTEIVEELISVQEARKELEAKEKELKEALLTTIDVGSVIAGKWTVTVEERRAERFDTTLARKTLPPEVVSSLLKVTTYKQLKIEEV